MEETIEEEESMEKEAPSEEETMEEELTEEVEEVISIEPKEKPVVIVVQETDLVNLVPKADDPDKDKLVFTFTSPLDENGAWQTAYGDSGEYTVTVTVSDGESTTSRDVLIIINKKEESPVIDSAKPIESALTVDETQSVDFSVKASDLNKDPLTYGWKLDGEDVSDSTEYTYQTTYDDSGSHTIKVEVSDGLSSASKLWSVDVKNVNRKPVLEEVGDIEAKETDKIVITALATDDDEDSITYKISDNKFMQEDNVFTWHTDYDSAGVYEITLSSSDGQDTTEETFKVTVENVNRPPVITDVLQK